MTFTDRISIPLRIYLGFGLLIVALIGLGFFAMVQFDKMTNTTKTVGEKIRLVSGANDYVISLQELTASVLLYAQSADPNDRKSVEETLAATGQIEKEFFNTLLDAKLVEEGEKVEKLFAAYSETITPLLQRIENTGASADMILMGAGKLVNSAPELSAKLNQIAVDKPDYAALNTVSQDILVSSNKALLDVMTYAIKPSDTSLQQARDATAALDDQLGAAKVNMKGLSRREKKVLKFVGRDNDLLKQGYVQYQGSNLGLVQSFTAFRENIEQASNFAAAIRQNAIEAQSLAITVVGEKTNTTIQNYTLILGIISLIGALLALFTSRSILGPLGRVTKDMIQLGEGDTSIEVIDRERRDEIGQMAQAVVIFRQNALEVDRLTQQRLEDQKYEEEKRSASLLAMADTIESETGVVLEKVANHTKELGDAVGMMSGSAEQASTQAGDVAKEAESSRDLAERVAGAADELATSIGIVAEKVDRQRTIADDAQGQAQKSSVSVQTLSEAADSIGSVVAMINDIAQQTNMLALNATIEAERAGEAGKGFAVVASEVKQLAAQTSNATAEIARQIQEVRAVTQDCVASIGQVNTIIGDMARISNEVTHSVEEQSQATRQITSTIQDSFKVSERLNSQVTNASDEMHGVRRMSAEVNYVSKRMTSMVESLQMSLNTAVRSASENLNKPEEDKPVLVDHDVEVTLTGPTGTFTSNLLDISNNGMSLVPAIDVSLNEEFTAEIADVPGKFEVEILSRRGLQSPKTRIRFVADLEERSEIVQYVMGLWAKRLRFEILDHGFTTSLEEAEQMNELTTLSIAAQ